jgi:predicted nucleic acid-binding protein
MDKIILDTSVLIKLFSEDEKDAVSEKLLSRLVSQTLSLIIPEAAVFELVNALKLSKKVNRKLMNEIIESLLEINPRIIHFSQELINKSLDSMYYSDLTIYDTLFITIAEIEKVPLLTADYKHHTKQMSRSVLYYSEWA